MNKVYLGILTVFVCVGIAAAQTKSDRSRAVALDSGTRISAELQKTLDVNNAKVGDQVVLKTTQSIKQDGQVVVPKGSTLIGRVTEVKRKTKDSAGSKIGMVFDRIQNKQLSLPLSATVVSISNAAARAAVDDGLMGDVSGSSRTSASTSRSGSEGGLLGGVSNTVGGLVNTTTETVGTVTNTAGQTVGNTTQTVGRTLSGIQISSEASGSASSSTTLSSPNRSVRVDKGATFHLRVAN